jgi:hypothetical protein
LWHRKTSHVLKKCGLAADVEDDFLHTAAAPLNPTVCRRDRTARAQVLWLWLLALLLPLLMAPAAQAESALLLGDAEKSHDLWRAAMVLEDSGGSWALPDVLARTAEFGPAGPLKGNLGRRTGAVWLRVLLQVPPDGDGRWMLDVDYPSLDHVDVFLLDGARVERQARLGDQVYRSLRDWPARSQVLALDLPPGAQRSLLIRVQTVGTMLVPATLYTPAAYAQTESAEQALQGLMAGMGLCLMVYSLVQWWMLGDAMFGLYAISLLGTTTFFAALSGVGPQHV